MNYLYETQHFLLRKRRPGDICLLPEAFPDSAAVHFTLKQDFCRTEDTTGVLMIEFLSTGAPAGEMLIRNLADGPDSAEALCCLYRGFQRDCFKTEIVDALS